MSKVKSADIFKWVKVGTSIGKEVAPGALGRVFESVSTSIADPDDPGNTAALEALAKENQEQTAAILALHERVKALEGRQ